MRGQAPVTMAITRSVVMSARSGIIQVSNILSQETLMNIPSLSVSDWELLTSNRRGQKFEPSFVYLQLRILFMHFHLSVLLDLVSA